MYKQLAWKKTNKKQTTKQKQHQNKTTATTKT